MSAEIPVVGPLTHLPLRDIRVVDLTMNISGPYGTMILGDLGASVIKIERPGGGDDARRMTPVVGDSSAYFMAVNRNKRSLTLALDDASDRETFESLLADADVFVTNWRPQKLAAFSLDDDSMRSRHPGLVYADITAYGNNGPEAVRAGYDMVLQARSGLMSVNGEPGGAPVRVGVSILDMGSGIWLALGVLAALRERDSTGVGGQVSTSLLEVGAAFMAYDAIAYQLTGNLPTRRGSGHPAFAPYGVFRCGSGTALTIGVGADHIFSRLAAAVGAPEWGDDPRFSTNAARIEHVSLLTEHLEARLADRTATEWTAILAAADVPADQVADVSEVLNDPQLADNEMWVEDPRPVDDRGGGSGARRVVAPGIPLRFDQRRPQARLPAPPLGEHHTAGAHSPAVGNARTFEATPYACPSSQFPTTIRRSATAHDGRTSTRMLTQIDHDFYWENGFLKVETCIAEPELEALRAASMQMIKYASTQRIPNPDYFYAWDQDAGRHVLTRINYPKKRSLEFAALIGNPRLLEIFENLLGPNFIVIDDALVFKLPGEGKEVPWHRDLAPGMTRAGWTLCVPGIELDSQTLENGCVHVVPGSNREESIDIDGLVAEHGFDLPGATPLETNPGDILVHSGNVLHASRPTDSPTLRRTLYIGAFGIDEYMDVYKATPEYVKLQMRNMFKTIQIRPTLPYLDGEEQYTWKGDDEWFVEVGPEDFVEWDLPASTAVDPK